MELTFESPTLVGSGYQPFAIHTPENIVQIIYVGEKGHLYAKEAATPFGEWRNLEFSTPYMISDDVDIQHMKLKQVDDSIFVVWKNAAVKGEVVPYKKGVVHSVRHRFALWETRQDLSKYIVKGDINFRLDDPVSSLNLDLENPWYVVSSEDDTILTPGTCLNLFFRAGDSAKYIMGKYYIDRNSMGLLEDSTSISARNTIGKLLKDQSFDEDNKYPLQNLKVLGESIMESFGILNYFVSSTDQQVGMEFPPDMDGLSGLQELLKTTSNWKLQEDLTGRIGFGYVTDSNFAQPATYTFYRDSDIFSRNVERDDMDAYSRVCVYDKDRVIQVYRDVNFRFVMGKRKTLHVQVADGTVKADAEKYADELASLVSSVGIIESFSGPFRPHIQVGDNAEIIGRHSKLLGIITSVKHSFGKSGFFTDFVVDSGSVANRTRVSDYISKISGKQSTGQVTRLYE